MKSLKFHLLIAFFLVAHTILLSHPVFSDDDRNDDHPLDDVNDDDPVDDVHDDGFTDQDEDSLVQGINKHRQGLKLSPLAKNAQLQCLADKLADELEAKPCSASSIYAKEIPISSGEPFTNYQNLLTQCNINISQTSGIILPVCVPNLVPTSVLGNYTQPPNGKYLSDSKFTNIGVEFEEDWIVVVLSSGNMKSK